MYMYLCIYVLYVFIIYILYIYITQEVHSNCNLEQAKILKVQKELLCFT